MKRTIFITAFITAVVFTCGTAYSAILVKSTKGDVAFKQGKQWKPLRNGQKLAEGTKISTGIRSSVLINIDGNMLKVRQLTMMKIFRNKTTAKGLRTHIGLKYGSLNARVKKLKKLKTSFKITTPVATSSVRGTEEDVSYGARMGMIIDVIHGSVIGENLNGVKNLISGRSRFQLGHNSPRPQGLLFAVQGQTLFVTANPFSTPDEQTLQDLFPDDSIGTDILGDSPVDTLNDIMQDILGDTSNQAGIQLLWPGGDTPALP